MTVALDNLPTFAATDGTLVKDSGIALTPLAGNIVRMCPQNLATTNTAATVPWRVLTPDGSAVPNIANTHTCGFNEAEAYAYTKGWSLEVCGWGESNPNSGTACAMTADAGSGGFVIHPLAQRFVKFRGVIMQSFAPVCMNVDSMVEGQILTEASQFICFATNGITWDISPTTLLPVEQFVGVSASRLEFGNIANQAASGSGKADIRFNLLGGGISANIIRATEVNGGGSGVGACNYGILIENDSVNFFSGNQIEIGTIHNNTTSSIKTGALANPGHCTGNIWRIGLISPLSNVDAIYHPGTNDQFYIGLINTAGGTYTNAVNIPNGVSKGNLFVFGNISGAGGASGLNPGFVDASGWLNTFMVNGAFFNVNIAGGWRNGLAPTSVTNGVLDAGSSNARGSFVTSNGTSTTFLLTFSTTHPGPSLPIVSAIIEAPLRASVSSVNQNNFTIVSDSAVPNGTRIYYSVQ
jgi:hypothetical protein